LVRLRAPLLPFLGLLLLVGTQKESETEEIVLIDDANNNAKVLD